MTFGKRQLVIAALVAALGAAVYLNWQFTGNTPAAVTQAEESSDKQLGQTTYVNTEVSSQSYTKNESSAEMTDKVKPVNSSPSSVDEGRFASERAKRRQGNADAASALAEVVEAASSSEAAKKDAVASAEKLAMLIKAQSDLESAVKAKGFEDAFVSVNNGSCAVWVSGGKIDDAAAIAIKDMVNRQAGIGFDKITVAMAK